MAQASLFQRDPSKLLDIEETWCCTDFKVSKYSFKWKINNLTFYRGETGEFIKSSTFPVRNSDAVTWRLKLYPKGRDERSKDFLSLYLSLVSCKKPVIYAKFRFSILNSLEQEIHAVTWMTIQKFEQKKMWGFKTFFKRSRLLRYRSNQIFHNDELTLCCHVGVVEDPVISSGPTMSSSSKNLESQLANDFEELYSSGKMSDVTLSVNDKDIPCHKIILSARSPVFAAMFEHEMEERRQHKVVITDIDYDTLKDTLYYIYTGKPPLQERLTPELLAAADKYALDGLKSTCEEVMCMTLSSESAADLLMFADLFNANYLKACAVNYINLYANEVKKSAGWRNMIEKKPELLAEAFQTYTPSVMLPPVKLLKAFGK